MLEIRVRNVNEALPKAMMYLSAGGEKVRSRGMETLEYPTPVCTTYERPLERVLFEPLRDANPFFHVMESLWILAGRNDVAFPAKYNSKLAQYSDDGKLFHGAYGHRLRHDKDQLDAAIAKLKREPDSRQVVLQIWDSRKDLNIKSNDIPCNDMIFLKIRHGKLRMTVLNRSNDAIWGAYGANAVQFSFLQEYLASMIGVEVGEYRQVSDSLHVYTDNPQWEKLRRLPQVYTDPYHGKLRPKPLVDDPISFDMELEAFMSGQTSFYWHNSFFPGVAIPMQNVWEAHKANKEGWKQVDFITAGDWQKACKEWLERREDHA